MLAGIRTPLCVCCSRSNYSCKMKQLSSEILKFSRYFNLFLLKLISYNVPWIYAFYALLVELNIYVFVKDTFKKLKLSKAVEEKVTRPHEEKFHTGFAVSLTDALLGTILFDIEVNGSSPVLIHTRGLLFLRPCPSLQCPVFPNPSLPHLWTGTCCCCSWSWSRMVLLTYSGLSDPDQGKGGGRFCLCF